MAKVDGKARADPALSPASEINLRSYQYSRYASSGLIRSHAE